MQRSGGSQFKASLSKQFRETLSGRKILHKNRAGGMAQVEGPEFKPQYRLKKKKKKAKGFMKKKLPVHCSFTCARVPTCPS
jgi:hypothetical protein